MSLKLEGSEIVYEVLNVMVFVTNSKRRLQNYLHVFLEELYMQLLIDQKINYNHQVAMGLRTADIFNF